MDSPRLATRAVHPPPGPLADRGLSPAIHQSSVYQAHSLDDAVRLERMADGVSSYTRTANPTVQAFELAVADLEDGEAGLAFPSGMAAVTAVLLTALRPGDAVVVSSDCYSDTVVALRMLQERMALRVVVADVCSPAGLDAVAAAGARLVVVESITNPLLRVPDLGALADLVHRGGGRLVVDNTVATPVNLRPLAWGADIIVHSASKYLAGHYAVIAGTVVCDGAFAGELAHWRTIFGACLDPHAAWSVLQGMQTLALRVERQNATAARVAGFLAGHPAVRHVSYPLLPNHPDAETARRQLGGGGGVVTFRVRADDSGVARFLESFQVARLAVSLGGTKTLVESPMLMSHVHGDDADGDSVIPSDAVRMSVGIEDPDDLLDDLERALKVL